jgi:Chaperone of endosialidase
MMRRLAATAIALFGLSNSAIAQTPDITQSGLAWLLAGNRPTGSTAFLGTINNRPLVLKSGGHEALRILPSGDVGIGTPTPGAPLEVDTSATDANAAKFVLSSPDLSIGSVAAVDAINSGGSTSMMGYYGSAGAFNITNPMNTAPAVWASAANAGGAAIYGTESGTGMGIFGDDESSSTCCPPAAGVYGFSLKSYGVHGVSGASIVQERGIEGSVGVVGDSQDGTGVYGVSGSGFAASFVGGTTGRGQCYFTGGGGWNCTSDQNLKTDFAPVNIALLLDRLARMPVFTYRFKRSVDRALFLGPTAQDFAAVFHLGNGDDRFINTANAEGVALAAAKGLYVRAKRDEEQIAADHAKIAALEARLARLEEIVARLAAGRPLQRSTLARR